MPSLEGSSRPHSRMRLAAAPLCAVGLAAGASADVVDTLWIDADNFQYRVTHMPDLDQRRLETESIPGLPNDGAMYCVPTATMNVLAYIANHGFPEVPPQPNNWGNPSRYNLATGNLFIFGVLMSTSPTGGTGWGGWKNGIEALLPLDKFTYSLYIADNSYTPRFKDMGQTALNGSLVEFCHGWYTEQGLDGGLPVITRGGGHCLTMTRAYAGLFNDYLYTRDPADDPANTTQSAFMERIFEIENREVLADGVTRVMSNLQTMPGTWSSRYLDGFSAIRPKAGYSFTSSQLFYYGPLRIWDSSPDPVLTIEAVANVSDVIIGPDQNNIYYVGRLDTLYRIYCANLQSRETTAIDAGPVSIAPQILFGRRRMMYELSGRNLLLFDPADPSNPAFVILPAACETMAYDDMKDEIAIMDVGSRRLFVYPYHLEGTPVAHTLPGAGQLPLANDAMMTWDPFRHAWWVVSGASDDVFQFNLAETGEWMVSKISHAVLVDPTSVDVDDAGNVFVVAGGHLHEFAEVEPGSGQWVLVPDSPFADAPVGSKARITKCRTNYDPVLHDGERWRNVLPADFGQPLPDCAADLNLNGAVDFPDILRILEAWGPCPPDHFCNEDLDFSGATGFGDLLVVLTAWGPCP